MRVEKFDTSIEGSDAPTNRAGLARLHLPGPRLWDAVMNERFILNCLVGSGELRSAVCDRREPVAATASSPCTEVHSCRSLVRHVGSIAEPGSMSRRI